MVISELQPIAGALAGADARRRQAIEGLADDQLRLPFPEREWSIQDTLAHLAANETLMRDLAECIATGERTSVPDDFDNERFNAESVAAGRAKATADILADLARSQQALQDFLERVTPDQLTRRGSHPLQGMLTLREFLVVMYSHRTEHTRDIEQHARRLRGVDPSAQRDEAPYAPHA